MSILYAVSVFFLVKCELLVYTYLTQSELLWGYHRPDLLHISPKIALNQYTT
jgi:hypothetical protein